MSAPRSAIAGTTITVTGSTKAARATNVTVQHAQGRNWKRLASGNVRKKRFTVRVKLGASVQVGTLRLRVTARRGTKTLAKSKTFTIKVQTPTVPGASTSAPVEEEGGGRGSFGGDYPDADAVDCSAPPPRGFGIYSWCKNGTWLSPRGYGFRNCVDYAAWVLGLPRGMGNAKDWKANASKGGLTVTNSPSVGDVAWWDATARNSFGHVAVVTAVYPSGAVDTVDYNGDGRGNKTIRSQTRADAYLHPGRPPANIVIPSGGSTGPAPGGGGVAPPAGDPNANPGLLPFGGLGRIAIRGGDGQVHVKEGPINAMWTHVTDGVEVDLAGDRIAVRTATGDVVLKEGPLNATWIHLTGNATQVDLAGNRIAYRATSGKIYVKEGPSNATWTHVSDGVEVHLAGNRIAVRHGNGDVYLKEGSINATWTFLTGNATQVDLAGNRIAYRATSGQVYVKEGPLNATWTHVGGGAEVDLAGDRIAIRGSDGNLHVKEGPLNAMWTHVTGNATQVDLTANRIAFRATNGQVYIKEGPLNATWTHLGGGAEVTLPQ